MKSLLRNILSFSQHGALPKTIVSPLDVVTQLPSKTIKTSILVGVDGYRWLSFFQKGRITAESVHCFEPNPALYHQLKRSFSAYHLHQGSLSEQEQVDSYIHYLDQDGTAVKKLNGLKDQVNFLVKSVPLSQVVTPEDQVDLIVVDRGFTVDRIVQGAAQTIENHHPTIVFQQSSYAESFHAGVTYDILTSYGYSLYYLSQSGGTALSREAMIQISDKVLIAR